ncbi:hypothetical protein BN855_12120 [Salmonella enterica subsp. enterica serovar Bovismorbificans str. 3114]|nr:hypothetical protein BN855_12120 [Salmonella enterica subsp. enterica serovar Bovismorbificans str. 3114]
MFPFYKTISVAFVILLDANWFCTVKVRQKLGSNNRDLVMGNRGNSFDRDLSGHKDALEWFLNYHHRQVPIIGW